MRHHRFMGLLCAFAALSGCVEIDTPACFQDARLVEGTLETTACCEPGDSGDTACFNFFSDEPTASFFAVAELGLCEASGACVIDCRDGANCECLVGSDLSAEGEACGRCRVVRNRAAVCAAHGQSEATCSICAECEADTDCANNPRGQVCQANGIYCGCNSDADCPDGKSCANDLCQ